MLTASTGVGTGADIETTGVFAGTSMAVQSGSNTANQYSSFSVVDVPVSAFGLTSGVSNVTGLSMNLTYFGGGTGNKYNTEAGTFDVYFIPDSSTAVPTSSMEFQGDGVVWGKETGLNAL
ncbi:MAG TPA: hypothetical protein VMF30_09855, partial [Pirellulales bacterium]|nr:hypothetical protein [Pirellulales bacterium]